MSDDATGSKILIKFEIHVPVGAGQSPVVVQPVPTFPTVPMPAPAAPPPGGGGKLGILSIKWPGATASVQATTGSTNGVICVIGEADTDALNRTPVDVWCEIINFASPIPASPDGNAKHAIKDDGLTYTNWHIYDLPNAKCSWTGSGTNLPYNELVVWRQYAGETFWTIEVKSFRGLCSDHTDCRGHPASGLAGATHLLDTIPQALQLVACGFAGALGALNGTWLLPRFPQAAAGFVAWSCGGDGVIAPRVELSGKSCGCDPVQLQVACAGRKLVYTIPRDAFNPLGPNRFVLRGDQRPPQDCQLPTELVVMPAQGLA